MTIELPNLDKKTFSEIRQQLIDAIPMYNSQWTNFNHSDPGITLIELICWLSCTLLYRLNRIPTVTYVNYLCLLAGTTGLDKQVQATEEDLDQDYTNFLLYLKNIQLGLVATIEEMQEKVLQFFNAPFLALTQQDFILLTLQTNRIISGDIKIARAIVKADSEIVTVIVVSNEPQHFVYPTVPNEIYSKYRSKKRLVVVNETCVNDNYPLIIAKVKEYLAPRILLGCIVNVVPPIFTPVNIKLNITCTLTSQIEIVINTVRQQIVNFLNPIYGGLEGSGWVYNEVPTADAIIQIINKIPGIKIINSMALNFIPTVELDKFASLDINTILENVPAGFSQPQFQGLPCLSILDIQAEKGN